MPFTEKQRRALTAKLKYRHVKTRSTASGALSYVEGWHVIAEANRIFGHDGWDRRTLSPQCVWTDREADQSAVFYTTKVRVTVRAGGDAILREGIGTGFGRSRSAEAAHEIALKAAETDATKRALATFGNPFGLALYDKDQAGVTRPPQPTASRKAQVRNYFLYRDEAGEAIFETPTAFTDEALATIRAIDSIEALYDFARRNRSAFRELRNTGPKCTALAVIIIAALKARAEVLKKSAPAAIANDQRSTEMGAQQRRALASPKERRIRNKQHLHFVARQPCLICGRQPSHAHHVRFAQPKALGMKVSDEFTVPLCSVHHDEVHRTGNEQRWWARQAIDPLTAADQLWATTMRLESEQANTLQQRDGSTPTNLNKPRNGS